MNKKFSKTILSSAVAGLLLVSGGAMAAEYQLADGNKLIVNGEAARIVDAKNKTLLAGINSTLGSIMTWNAEEATKVESAVENMLKQGRITKEMFPMAIQIGMESIMYPVDNPNLKMENLKKITQKDINAIQQQQKKVADVITSATKDEYVAAVRSGGNSDAALAMAKNGPGVLQEYNRVVTNIDELNKSSNFYLDEGGNITLENNGSYGSVSVKETVAGLVDDTTVSVAEDGSLTMDRSTSNTKRVNEALVDLDKSVKDRTTVGMNSDGSLTTAEGAAKTVAVSEGLVSLSGRTDRIDAAVGGIDTRVTKNTQAIQNHSRQLQEHNARLNSQQRQIRENHEEMKRAAAQSAALSGLFQPYSVGKFNATAALGGYSDKQAVAVGVGYRFNEQTAAKAGIAASDGDVSYNVGVNFEF
ncbi:TPA: YadA-like family protein [Escherichia coli]|uniref:Putative immunoglobulin-binding protein from phage origin n=2 Tax=Escherichia coli TaxID=562 RepID=A0A376M7K0_ECOLX|nr:YadA C-terminal domain-containing protein [Escherichia coli]EFE7099723.1 hypothetical protein [Escherichia coli]EFH9530148.1 hypothetical protein [Escherichia coli]EGO3799513.1 hypothetical protein [Escherichia coli]EHH6919157.1 hypothetical protein [Escherichia coli]EHX7550152.1 YadA-like family protein [Escherichia coli]